MIKLPYNYKGRPLTPYGKKKPNQGRLPYGSRRSGGWTAKLIICFAVMVLFLSAGGLLVNLCSKWFSEAPPSPAESEPVPPVESVPLPAPEDAVPSVPAVKPPASLPPPSAESAAVQRQAMQVYALAAKAFQQNKLEEARRYIRPLFQMITPSNPLYDKGQTLLGRVSMRLYSSGADSGGGMEYVVKSGDNLSSIAKKHKVSLAEIMRASSLRDTNLRIGQKLTIPRNAWSVRIDRSIDRLLLYSGGRLFKVYTIRTDAKGKQARIGSYRIHGKRMRSGASNGSQWLGLRSDRLPSEGLGIVGTDLRSVTSGRSASADAGFILSKLDADELAVLVPEGTAVELVK